MHNAQLLFHKPEIDTIHFSAKEKSIDILRLDIVHPIISGNKWYKLRYNVEQALLQNRTTLLTFGGAYSNHLIATAAVAKELKLKSVGIVRGLYAKENLTPTLQACAENNMELHFISREDYIQKEDKNWLQKIEAQFPGAYTIPEGGNNEFGKKGIEEMAAQIRSDYTHVAVSVGSGTTFSGIRNALPETIKILGFAPMKNGCYLADKLQLTKANWQLTDRYHFGGFGKWNEVLIEFMNQFYQLYKIPLDMVYTAKMFYGIKDLLEQNYFPEEARILCIHTGGLQGNACINERLCYENG